MGNKYLEKIAAKFNVEPPSDRGQERVKSVSLDNKEMKRYEKSKGDHFANKAGKYGLAGAAAGAALGYAFMRKPRMIAKTVISTGSKAHKVTGVAGGAVIGGSVGISSAEERAHNKALSKVTGRK